VLYLYLDKLKLIYMKPKFILSIAFSAIVITFISCSKASVATTGNTADSTYFISQDSSAQNGTNEQIRVFLYNSSNQLIKVKYRSGGNATFWGYDTISYVNNYPSKLLTYNTGTTNPTDTALLYYSQAGLLDSISENGGQGSYSDSHAFFYSGNDLDSTLTHTYYGSNNNGGPTAIARIVFTSNNLSSGIAYISGVPTPVTLTADLTAANPYYGLVFKNAIDNFIGFFDHNNALKAYPTLSPSTLFNNTTYTYANGMVATITDSTQSPLRVTTLSYVKL
jgi:hypothetical protein